MQGMLFKRTIIATAALACSAMALAQGSAAPAAATPAAPAAGAKDSMKPVPMAPGGGKDKDATKSMMQNHDPNAAVTNRFKNADTNQDGKLTREEATAKMPRVAKNFDQIDTEKKGYITLDQIIKYNKDNMGQAKAAQAGQTPPGGAKQRPAGTTPAAPSATK